MTIIGDKDKSIDENTSSPFFTGIIETYFKGILELFLEGSILGIEAHSDRLINSIALSSGSEMLSRITDTKPNIEQCNSVAWGLSEALLRMMYNSDNTAVFIEKNSVDTSYWAKTIGSVPRVPAFRDQSFINTIGQWMKKFGTVSYDEWTSTKCYTPYSCTEANIVLYNPTHILSSIILFVIAIAYGALIYGVIFYFNSNKSKKQ